MGETNDFSMTPQFIRMSTPEGRKMFFDILDDPKLSKAKLEEKIDQWANQQGGKVLEEMKKEKRKLAEFNDALSKLISNSSLSDEARTMLQEMESIPLNKELTVAQEAQQMKGALRRLRSLPIYKEVVSFMADNEGKLMQQGKDADLLSILQCATLNILEPTDDDL